MTFLDRMLDSLDSPSNTNRMHEDQMKNFILESEFTETLLHASLYLFRRPYFLEKNYRQSGTDVKSTNLHFNNDCSTLPTSRKCITKKVL